MPSTSDDSSHLSELIRQILEVLARQETAIQQLAVQQTAQIAKNHEALCEKLDMKLAELSSCGDKAKLVSPTALSPAPHMERPREKIRLPQKSETTNFADGPTQADSSSTLSSKIAGSRSTGSVVGLVRKGRQFISSSAVESALGMMILLDILVMFAQLQCKGYVSAYKLGLRADDASYDKFNVIFERLQVGFNAIYLADLLLRFCVFPLRRFCEPLMAADAAVVVLCSAEAFLLEPLGWMDLPGLAYLRAVRAARIFRSIRAVRIMTMFNKLRLLIRTLGSTVDDLMWGMALMFFIIMVSGMVTTTLTYNFVNDDSQNHDRRVWFYENFGSSLRASYTLFEGAFTGSWRKSADPLIYEISPLFILFWIPYIVFVNFGVTRVIGALFVKQAIKVASGDADQLARETIRRRKKFADAIQNVFRLGDSSGDGLISVEEFEVMIDQPEVLSNFQRLDLDVDEVKTLFQILSQEDGCANYKEFVVGAMKMKGSARNLDAIQIIHDIGYTQRHIEKLSMGMEFLLHGVHNMPVW